MKKVLLFLIVFSLTVILIGCSNSQVVSVNVENKNDLSGSVFGIKSLIEIGDMLWYDSSTRIVYLWNGYVFSDHTTTPSPYYAPNGMPYKYNPSTNAFEEIN